MFPANRVSRDPSAGRTMNPAGPRNVDRLNPTPQPRTTDMPLRNALGAILILAAGTLAGSVGSTARAQQAEGLGLRSWDVSTYAPDSPWSHGKVFQRWIGHGGVGYNCDREECKRNSPYITWKSVSRCETKRVGWSVLQHDIEEVKARVRAGQCQQPCWPRQLCPDCNQTCDCDACSRPGTQPLPGWESAGHLPTTEGWEAPAVEALPEVPAWEPETLPAAGDSGMRPAVEPAIEPVPGSSTSLRPRGTSVPVSVVVPVADGSSRKMNAPGVSNRR